MILHSALLVHFFVAGRILSSSKMFSSTLVEWPSGAVDIVMLTDQTSHYNTHSQ